jgi:hypothetical protein
LDKITDTGWFLALDITRNKKSSENPMQVPSRFKERDHDEKAQNDFK